MNDNIRYSHATHEEYNKRFEPKEAPSGVDRQWIASENIPPVLKDFYQSAYDSMSYSRVENAEYAIKEGSEQREEQDGRGSGMVQSEQPKPVYKPPPSIRNPVDRENFKSGWLQEQHEAAMRSAKLYEQSQTHQREQDYQPNQTQNRSNDYEYTR